MSDSLKRIATEIVDGMNWTGRQRVREIGRLYRALKPIDLKLVEELYNLVKEGHKKDGNYGRGPKKPLRMEKHG